MTELETTLSTILRAILRSLSTGAVTSHADYLLAHSISALIRADSVLGSLPVLYPLHGLLKKHLPFFRNTSGWVGFHHRKARSDTRIIIHHCRRATLLCLDGATPDCQQTKRHETGRR